MNILYKIEGSILKQKFLYYLHKMEWLGIVWNNDFALKTEKWLKHTPASFIVRRPVPKAAAMWQEIVTRFQMMYCIKVDPVKNR